MNTNSQDWLDVTAHINKRVDVLSKELCSEGFDHTPEKDAARRAKIAELNLLVSTFTKKPENRNE